jgi:hypothetical protein
MHATLNQIYVYVLSRVVVTESIIILCGCGTSFSLDKKINETRIDKQIVLVTRWSGEIYSRYTHIAQYVACEQALKLN